MMGRATACALAAILLAAAPAHASVDDYLGRPIASVHLILEGQETTDPSRL